MAALVHKMTTALHSFHMFTKQLISQITNMHLMSYQAVQDIDLAISKLTKVSQELNEKIKVFQLEQ
ncbi:hypothetical protein B0I26_11752 [Anoxybacillus vitaminiphilus]|uniref:Uncharacterized protein n=1 Tax=Paranoxybacillus vitaminiphilus TaxID=581036 RepID=A0A327Y838_9BACL|nr:hypothetical protein [Anoxybacillus vitaminiphilus]RAK16637.1 hypothetical protein B0I26_11752 [Anoxybacillus vitaminiphilus]